MAVAAGGDADGLVRTTALGKVRGAREGGSLNFLGLPYAAAPVGALRWAPPSPPTPWSGIRDASQFGPACPQRAREPIPMGEDCLSLNISVPATAQPGAKLPVLVRIHGGGMVTGSGRAEHSGAFWNSNGVILVTMNYRLGALGYFSHPALREGRPRAPANFALLDMKAALQWVHANIAAFGGDPGNVTLTGVSAGAEGVQLLGVMPGADGLYARAISSSGYSAWPLPAAPGLKGQGDADAMARGIAKRAAGGTEPATAAALRALPASALVEAVSGFQPPIVDGVTLLDDPLKLYARGAGPRTPILTGGNSWEGSVFPASGVTKDEVWALLGDRRDAVRALYAPDFRVSDDQGVRRIFGDYRYVLSSARISASAAGRRPVWIYYVDYLAPDRRGQLPGTPHAGETPLIERGGPDGPGPAMRAYWLNFIRSGDPNGAGLPIWPGADAQHSRWMVFSDKIAPGDPIKDRLSALEATLR